jgi:hypothetical protein
MTVTQQQGNPVTQSDMTATQQPGKPVSRWTRMMRRLEHLNKVLAGI